MELAQILKLPTPRLLTYYKKYYRGPNPYTDYWGYIEENQRDEYEAFEAERKVLKDELDNREHVT